MTKIQNGFIHSFQQVLVCYGDGHTIEANSKAFFMQSNYSEKKKINCQKEKLVKIIMDLSL